MLDLSRAGRGTGPISDGAVLKTVQSMSMKDVLRKGDWNPKLKEEFLSAYVDWIQGSKSTPVSGLDAFKHRYFANGVTQAYDIFFFEHQPKRFRTLKGEYPYVRLSAKNWLHLEDDELRPNDAVVMSCPFYADGGIPPNFQRILDRCQELGIPVMIDAAYFGTCYDVMYDYSHPAIEMVGFSLSKPFSAQSFRIGTLFSKRPLGYLEELQVQSRYYNRVGAFVGLELMRRFPADYMPNRYRNAQRKVCAELDLLPSHCIMLGNLHDDDRRFDKILEDKRFEPLVLPAGERRRVCVSAYMGNSGSPLRRLAKQIVQAGKQSLRR